MIWFLLAIFAAVFETAAILVEKKTLIKEHALEFCTIVSLFAFILSFSFINKVNFNLSLDLYFLIFLSGIFITIGYLLVAKGIRHMDVSIASPMLIFSPAFVAILAFIFLGEKIKGIQLAGIVIIVFGGYFLNYEGSMNFSKVIKRMYESKSVRNILIGIFIWSFARLFDKYLLNFITQYTYLFLIHFFVAANFLLILFIFYDGMQGIKHGIKGSFKWLFLMSVLIVLARLSYLSALQTAYLTLVFVIFKSSNLLVTVIGGSIFHEKKVLHRILAAMVMVLGIYLVII